MEQLNILDIKWTFTHLHQSFTKVSAGTGSPPRRRHQAKERDGSKFQRRSLIWCVSLFLSIRLFVYLSIYLQISMCKCVYIYIYSQSSSLSLSFSLSETLSARVCTNIRLTCLFTCARCICAPVRCHSIYIYVYIFIHIFYLFMYVFVNLCMY